MPFRALPLAAAWQHRSARVGFEVVFTKVERLGVRLVGDTVAVEDGVSWVVHYDIVVDENWRTRSSQISGRSAQGERSVTIESDGAGNWMVAGAPRADLAGCFDVDLESSACTNAMPIHRLLLAVDAHATAPAVYVRATGLGIERIDQHYRRLADDGRHQRYHYRAPAFDFVTELIYDESGLVLEYPGIATRAL